MRDWTQCPRQVTDGANHLAHLLRGVIALGDLPVALVRGAPRRGQRQHLHSVDLPAIDMAREAATFRDAVGQTDSDRSAVVLIL